MPMTCSILYCFGLNASYVRSEVNRLILGQVYECAWFSCLIILFFVVNTVIRFQFRMCPSTKFCFLPYPLGAQEYPRPALAQVLFLFFPLLILTITSIQLKSITWFSCHMTKAFVLPKPHPNPLTRCQLPFHRS